MRIQAAVDFLMAYGIALIIVSIAIAVMVKLMFLTPTLAISTCTPQPGFACQYYSISTNGILTISLAQDTGTPIDIEGLACSSLPNTTGNKPAYGNIYVTNSIAYYPPSNSPGTGIILYPGAAQTFNLYCYSSGGIAKGYVGGSFIGYLWLNYTVPSYGKITQQVASLNLRYS